MASFYSNFKNDKEFPDERRVWETRKPFFQSWASEFSPFSPEHETYKLPKGQQYPLEPSCPTSRVASDEIGVFLFEWSDEAMPLQQAGWEFLQNNLASVEAALTKKLLALQARYLEQLAEEIEGMDEWADHWNVIEGKLNKPAAESVERFYKLVGISLAGSGLDECCFVGFDFQTGWDLDHGLEIVMHKDRVLVAGGMTEHMSPFGSIIDGIKASQQYNADPDDLIL